MAERRGPGIGGLVFTVGLAGLGFLLAIRGHGTQAAVGVFIMALGIILFFLGVLLSGGSN